jgi:DNA sulfur modification protein DndB
MSEDQISVPAFKVTQIKHSFLIFRLPAAALVRIAYVAARGASKEKTAVQRILTRSRIAGISEFAKAGGDFPASIVLNWVDEEQPLRLRGGKVKLTLKPSSAQILDGQHRVEGMREAMKTNPDIGKLEVPVAVYEQLTATECADIFLSINTEQKPVSRSLVFDLYGIASEYVRDDDGLAAKRIADQLNERDDSPYRELIRYPGPETGKGGIALSSVVSVLKPLLENNGAFDRVGIPADKTKERVEIILNWLKVIQSAYGTQWTDKGNVFRYASGFWGAMEFLASTMLKHCNNADSFEQSTMRAAMKGLKDDLFWQTDVRGMQGRRSANLIAEHLGAVFAQNKKTKSVIKV